MNWNSPAEFAAAIKADVESFGEMAKAAGVQSESRFFRLLRPAAAVVSPRG